MRGLTMGPVVLPGPAPPAPNLFSRRFRAATGFVGFRFEQHRRRAGDAAVFPYAPEVHNHEHGGNDWNANAVPDVGTQQRVRIYDGPTQQAETNVVVGRHVKQRAEGTL